MTEPLSEEALQARNLLEANWRMGLPEEFRPIAERHGQDWFVLAYNVGSCNEALNKIAHRSKGNAEIMTCVQFIQSSMNVMASIAMEAKGLDLIKLQEVQRDIERAAALAGATRKPDGGRIIVPS